MRKCRAGVNMAFTMASALINPELQFVYIDIFHQAAKAPTEKIEARKRNPVRVS